MNSAPIITEQALKLRDASSFPERLQQIIGHRSVRSFARHCGISDSVLRQYLRGKSEPTRPVLLAIACCTGVAVEWLASGTGPMKIERNPAMVQLADGDFTSLPYVMVPDETVQTVKVRQRSLKNLLFRSEWLKKELAPDINGLAMATAHGNAMAPAIDDGDAILVDTHQKTIEKEGIYLLQVNGTIIARRIQVMMDGTLRATCDNPLYTTQIIDQAEMTAMQIVGKVVWVGKKIL